MKASSAGATLWMLCLTGCTVHEIDPSVAATRGAKNSARTPIARDTAGPRFVTAPGSPISMPGPPSNVAAGDVNEDGSLDLVIPVGQGPSLVVLLGSGTGSFRPAPGSPVPLPEAGGEMALADLNGDGRLDVALTNHDTYNVTLLSGDGQGRFAPAPGSPLVMKTGGRPHTHGLAVADLNGDGRLDIATVNSTDGDVSVMLDDGRGRYQPAPGSPFGVGPGPYPLAIGDVNADGAPDIVTPDTGLGGSAAGRTVTVLLGDGKGRFRPSPGSPFGVAERPYYACLGDLNGDGKLDLATSHDDSSAVTILRGDGQGSFMPAPGSPLDLGARAFAISVADADRDGRRDLIAAAGESVRVLLGDGRDDFRAASGSPYAVGRGAWRLATGDHNGDGKLDIATPNFESGDVTVLLGR